MSQRGLLHVIGEKISYRQRDNESVTFFIRSSSRSDQRRINHLQFKCIFIFIVCLILTIPFYFNIEPIVKWMIFLFFLIPFGWLIQNIIILLLKKYGIETLTLLKNEFKYKRYINHPFVAIVIEKSHEKHPLCIVNDKLIMKSNSIFSSNKIITSFLNIRKKGKQSYLTFHPELKEREELINKLNEFGIIQKL